MGFFLIRLFYIYIVENLVIIVTLKQHITKAKMFSKHGACTKISKNIILWPDVSML